MLKRKLNKFISSVIVLIFMFQVIPAGVIASSKGPNHKAVSQVEKKDRPAAKNIVTKKPHKIPQGLKNKEDILAKWKEKKEIIEERTINSKSFRNKDGTNTVLAFFAPIHVLNRNGEFQDIDNTLIQGKEKTHIRIVWAYLI